MQEKVMVVDDADKKFWTLISNVPLVSKPVAIIQAVLNLILPGFGTMVAGCAS